MTWTADNIPPHLIYEWCPLSRQDIADVLNDEEKMPEERNQNQMGYVTVSAETLTKVLMLPEGTKIRRFLENPLLINGAADLDIILEGPHLPVVDEGCAIPHVQIQYKRDETGTRFVGYSW